MSMSDKALLDQLRDDDIDAQWAEHCACRRHRDCEDCQGYGFIAHAHDETSRPRTSEDMDDEEAYQ
jgi:hypothetical protein